MPPKLPPNRVYQSPKRRAAILAALDPAASRRSEHNIPPGRPQRARFAMIVVATRHHSAVNVQDEVSGDRPVLRLLHQPPIRRVSRAQLPLRARHARARRRIGRQRLFLLPPRELRPLYARSAYRLQPNLLFVYPFSHIRHPIQRPGSCLSIHQRIEHCPCVIPRPLPRHYVSAHIFVCHSLFMSPFISYLISRFYT